MLAEQIRKRRKQENLTQMELASLVGVTQGAVAQWESGLTTPTVDVLSAIAKVLHCTIDALMNGDEDDPVKDDLEK